MRNRLCILVVLLASLALAAGCSSTSAKEKNTPAKAADAPKTAAPDKPAATVKNDRPKTQTVQSHVATPAQPQPSAAQTAKQETEAYDKPTPQDVKAALETDAVVGHIAYGRSRFYEVGIVRPTNGMVLSQLGYTLYRMEYEIVIKCLDAGPTSRESDFNPIPCHGKGQIVHGTGRLDFEKTERGWRLPDPQLLLDQNWFKVKIDQG